MTFSTLPQVSVVRCLWLVIRDPPLPKLLTPDNNY